MVELPLIRGDKSGIKIKFLLLTILLVFIGIWFIPPIPQDIGYHSFADQREILGVPNFWNVITNIPFFVFGVVGMFIMNAGKLQGGLLRLRAGYNVFFFGMVLLGFGSAYYHFAPSNQTLVWDRLPMTISFMAFFSIILGEHLSEELGNRLLWPLLILGVLSVVYWSFTEAQGRGDLRPYALVQFLPMLLMPMVLLMFRSAFRERWYIWVILAIYVVSKIAEALDESMLGLSGGLSGHSIKHLVASMGAVLFFLALVFRRPNVE